jgi:hypothetical protein
MMMVCDKIRDKLVSVYLAIYNWLWIENCCIAMDQISRLNYCLVEKKNALARWYIYIYKTSAFRTHCHNNQLQTSTTKGEDIVEEIGVIVTIFDLFTVSVAWFWWLHKGRWFLVSRICMFCLLIIQWRVDNSFGWFYVPFGIFLKKQECEMRNAIGMIFCEYNIHKWRKKPFVLLSKLYCQSNKVEYFDDELFRGWLSWKKSKKLQFVYENQCLLSDVLKKNNILCC